MGLVIRTKRPSSAGRDEQLGHENEMIPQKNGNVEENEEEEEPVTPVGRMFVQPSMSCNVICIMGFKNPVDIPLIKRGLLESICKHKRFSSIVKLDKHGREQWVRTKLNIDDHIIVPSLSAEARVSQSAVEDYAAGLSLAPPLDPSRPLWEFHILNIESAGAAGSCVFRIHHALGDGTSLMSLFLASTRRVDKPEELPSIEPLSRKQQQETRTAFYITLLKILWRLLLVFWHTLIEVGRFTAVSFFLKDSATAVKGDAGVEHLPKKIVSVEFSLEDMRTVKKAVKGTVNDVLLGMVSAGISRYLKHRLNLSQPGDKPRTLKGLRVHASGLVNTRPSPGLQELTDMMKGSSQARWGNQMGYLLLPIPIIECADPLEYLHLAKAVSNRKKSSLEAHFTYGSGKFLMKLAGAKFAADMTYRTLVHSTLSLSNIMGPLEQVMFVGNPITSIVPTVFGQPQALCIHMQSYMGKVRLVAIVATDVIPDPEILLQHCKDALQEMKDAASKRSPSEQNK